jgi:multiple sugar transport system permease protein
MAALVSPHRAKRWATTTTLYGLVAMVAMWLMGPFVWLFITSISNQRDLMVRPMPLIPPTLNLDNYAQILNLVQSHSAHQTAQILPSLINSIIVTVIVTVINVLLGSAAGYAYARLRSKRFSEHAERARSGLLLLHVPLHDLDHEGVLRDHPARIGGERHG